MTLLLRHPLVIACAALAVLLGASLFYAQGLRTTIAKLERDHAAALARQQAEAVAQSETARERERNLTVAMAAIDEELSHAKDAVVRVERDRLRKPVACLQNRVVPGPPSTTRRGDGPAADGGSYAEALIGLGREADSRLAACQAVIRAYRP